ncbi:hypothetical protein P3S68_002665 [Capsicum galapagoense]
MQRILVTTYKLLQLLAQLVKGKFCCNSLLNRKSLECGLTAKQRVHWFIEWWSTLVFNSSHPYQTKNAPILESSTDGASPATATSDQSGDLSLDVKSNVVQKKDLIRFNFLAWSDLSNQKAPVISYALAIYFEPGQAQLWSVLLPIVLTLVASKDSKFTAIVGDYIYSKWALEEFIIANARSGESFSIVSKDVYQGQKATRLIIGTLTKNHPSRCCQSLRSIFVIDNFPEKNKTSLLLSCFITCYPRKNASLQFQYDDENVGKPQKVGSLVKILVHNYHDPARGSGRDGHPEPHRPKIHLPLPKTISDIVCSGPRPARL